MILQKEIAAIAAEQGVLKITMDKDWALGHFLDAIFSISDLKEKLVFKVEYAYENATFPLSLIHI